MQWSSDLPIGTALERGEGGETELDVLGVSIWWSKTRRSGGGGGPKVCKIFYLERFVCTSWLIGVF